MKNLYLKLIGFLLISLFLLKVPAYADTLRASKTLDAADEYVSVSGVTCPATTFQLVASMSFSGTVTFQATTDGSTWVAVNATNANTQAAATTATGSGLFIIPSGGYNRIRAILTSVSAGDIVVTGQCGGGDNANIQIPVNVVSGATNTQYTEGDTDASVTGTALLWEDAGNTLATVNASKPLPVSAAQATASNFNAQVVGSVADGMSGSSTNPIIVAGVDGSGNTQSILSDTGGAVQADIESIAAGNNNIGDVDVASIAAGNNNIGDVDVASIAAGSNIIGQVSIDQTTPGTTNKVSIGTDGTVAINTALPAGTNAIGKLAANSGVDIGDVDVTSAVITTFPDNEPFNIAQVNGTTTPVATNGTDTTGAGVIQTGPLFQADDAATTACTENRFCPPRINATRRSILVEGVASGTAISTTETNSATIAGDTTDIEAAVEIIDDWDNAASDGASVSGDIASGSSDAGEPVKIGAKAVPIDGTDPGETVTEDQRTNLRADLNGLLLIQKQHPFSWCATEEETGAVTNDEIKAAPGAGLSLYVCSFIVSNGATAGDYSLKEDTGGTPVTLQGKVYTAINGGAVIHYDPCIRVTADQEIGVTSTTVTTGSYTVCGFTAP